MVRSTVSSNFAYLTCLSRLTASGSGYAGLVTAARAFAIFLLTFAIHSSSPTALASPICWETPSASVALIQKICHPAGGSIAVVIVTARKTPPDTSMKHRGLAAELQTNRGQNIVIDLEWKQGVWLYPSVHKPDSAGVDGFCA